MFDVSHFVYIYSLRGFRVVLRYSRSKVEIVNNVHNILPFGASFSVVSFAPNEKKKGGVPRYFFFGFIGQTTTNEKHYFVVWVIKGLRVTRRWAEGAIKIFIAPLRGKSVGEGVRCQGRYGFTKVSVNQYLSSLEQLTLIRCPLMRLYIIIGFVFLAVNGTFCEMVCC